MKNVFVCAFMCLAFMCVGHAQFRTTPQAVKDAFRKKYPQAEQAAWKSKDRIFQVEFRLMGIAFEADFTETGTWLQCAQDILPESIPEDVKYGVEKTGYKDWNVKEAAFIVGQAERTEYRLLLFKNAVQYKYLFFDSAGQLKETRATK